MMLTVSVDLKHDRERTAFMNERVYGDRTLHFVGGCEKNKTKKPLKAKDGDKNLRFSDCSQEIQAGLQKARADELAKWQKFNAAVFLDKTELRRLLHESVSVQPIQ